MKKIFLILLLLAGAYAGLLARPGLYFNKSVSYLGFTVRARGALPEGLEPVLDAARDKLSASELYSEDARFELIVPSKGWEYALFTPLQKGDYYRVNPFHGAVFLAAADFKAAEARPASAGPARRLSAEIAGAAAWELSRRLLRPLTYIFRKDWEVRGYASHVSGLTGDHTPSDACGTPSGAELTDYKYGLMMETITREDNITYKELLNRKMSYEAAETRLQRAHCGG